MPMEIEMFPDEVIALNRELASGLHPQLEPILHSLPSETTFAERLGHIAAYCDIVLDGMYMPNDIAGICGTLVKRLELKRERPDNIIIVN